MYRAFIDRFFETITFKRLTKDQRDSDLQYHIRGQMFAVMLFMGSIIALVIASAMIA